MYYFSLKKSSFVEQVVFIKSLLKFFEEVLLKSLKKFYYSSCFHLEKDITNSKISLSLHILMRLVSIMAKQQKILNVALDFLSGWNDCFENFVLVRC